MKRKTLPLLAFLALCPCLALPSSRLSAEMELPASLSVGDTLSVPSKRLSYNGQTKDSDILLTSPSGAVYSGSKLTIEENGVYTVTYRAFFGEHEEKETHRIRVDYSACDLFKKSGDVALSRGAFSYDPSFAGVKATFKYGSSLSFRKPLELDKLGMDTPLVSFLIDPSAVGSADFATFNIKIVDIYDENNYVTLNCVDSGPINCDGEAMYVKAGANGQTLYGYETDEKRHSDSLYGSSIFCSFRAISSGGDYHPAEFYFDASALDVYGYPNFLAKTSKRKIVGLASKVDHPTDPFAGFTSNLAYLSFEAKDFSVDSGEVVFTSIGGMDLSQDAYLDNEAPKITLDLAGNSTLPPAVLRRPYPLFQATSLDEFDGSSPQIDTKVYFLPGDGKKIDVSVSDGAFIPTQVGQYEIVYSASDRFLNQSQETLLISCLKSSYPLLGTLPYYKAETSAYASLELPGLDEFTVSGGSGAIRKSRILIDPDGQAAAFSGTSFTPEKIGVYTFRYQAFDYLNQAAVADLKVTVKNLSEPIFLGEPALPKAFLANEEAVLPTLEAKMPGQSAPVDCPVEICVDGAKLQGNRFTPTGESVEIAYVASTLRETFTVPVVDVAQGGKQENYLYGRGEASLSEDAILFKASAEGEVSFLRSLKPSEVSLKFTLPDIADGEEASLRLSDGKDTLTLPITKKGAKYLISGPSGSEVDLSLDSDGTISLVYDNATRQLCVGSGLPIMVLNQNDEGGSFKGFAEAIFLSFLLDSGRSVSLHKINNQPFGYRGRGAPLDEIGPEIVLPALPAVKQKVGSTILLPASASYDVLNLVSSFTLTVTKPNNEKIELDPTSPNALTFDEYGFYRFEFVAGDAKGNFSKTVRLFSAQEENAPTLRLTSSLKDVYSIGEEIALPSYAAEDDSASYVLTMILLTPKYERLLLLKDDSGAVTYYLSKEDYSSYRVSATSFKLSEEGEYSLLINVRDQFYNLTSKRLRFRVKGAN